MKSRAVIQAGAALLGLIGFLILWSQEASAQTTTRPQFYNASNQPTYVSAGNPWPVTGSFSSAGFAPVTTGTQITADNNGETGTLPAGAVVAVFNTSTTIPAYCKLGASATTSDMLIAPSSWLALTVGAATQLTCITASSTAVINTTGGSGSLTGAGGGGGSGGGGAVTLASGAVASGAYSSGSIASGAFATGAIGSGAVASGAYASGAFASGSHASGSVASGAIASGAVASGAMVDLGAQADSVCATATGTCSLIALAKYNNSVSPVLGAGTAYIGKTRPTDGTNDGVLDPCQTVAKTNKPFTTNGTSSVELVAISGSTTVYVCSMSFIAAGATTVAFTTGTGTACATSNAAVMGSTTSGIANSMSFAANGGLTLGNGQATVASGAASSAFCMINGTNVYVSGNLTYVQR